MMGIFLRACLLSECQEGVICKLHCIWYLAEHEICRPEVMRPLGDAVSFVDASKGDGRQMFENSSQAPLALALHYGFRRHQQHMQLTLLEFLLHALAVWHSGSCVGKHRTEALANSPPTTSFIRNSRNTAKSINGFILNFRWYYIKFVLKI